MLPRETFFGFFEGLKVHTKQEALSEDGEGALVETTGFNRFVSPKALGEAGPSWEGDHRLMPSGNEDRKIKAKKLGTSLKRAPLEVGANSPLAFLHHHQVAPNGHPGCSL